MTIGDWFGLPLPPEFAVYALYGADDARPLYIGQSVNALARVGKHLSDGEKRAQVARIAVLPCSTEAAMVETETQLIAEYDPPWNTAGLSSLETAKRRHAKSVAMGASAESRFDSVPWLDAFTVGQHLGCTVTAVQEFAAHGLLPADAPDGAAGPRFRPEWVTAFADTYPDLAPRITRTRRSA